MSYLVQLCDFEEQKKKDATLLKNKKKRNDDVEKALLRYDKFQDQLRLDTIAWQAEQEGLENNINNQLLSSPNESSSPLSWKKKKKLVCLCGGLWELSDVSTTSELDILVPLFRADAYKFAANKPANMAWIPRDRLHLHDVVRGYKSLQKEYIELDDFLSKAASTTMGDKNNNVESLNDGDEDNMSIFE
jgi:hypothetical protein